MSDTAAPQTPATKSEAGAELPQSGRLGRLSANFWREFMYFWTEHWPPFVLLTRPFFLFFAYRFSEGLRDGPTANARRFLGPDAGDDEVEVFRRSIVRSAYTSIYELGRASRSTPAQLRAWVESIEGTEHYHKAREAGRGAILVTAHLGPFEVGISALMDHETRIHVVFQRDERASFDRLRSKLRRRLGVTEAAVDDGWSIWGQLRAALEANEVVLIQGDRVMPGQRGVPAPFLGGHVLLPTGPVKLAILTGSPIIPVFSVRTRVGRCRVTIDEPIYASREDGPVDERHPALLRIAKAIERQVAAHPQQWAVYERAWCEDRDSA